MSACKQELLRIVDEEILIDEGHWCKGTFGRDKDGNASCWSEFEPLAAYCVIGAAIRAARIHFERSGMWCTTHFFYWNGLTPSFNDHPSTTFNHVKARLRLARERVAKYGK